jgi:hypothetical protein
VIVENQEGGLQGSDIQGLSADLLEAARRRNLSDNSLATDERTWTRFLAWAAAAVRSTESSFSYRLGCLSVWETGRTRRASNKFPQREIQLERNADRDSLEAILRVARLREVSGVIGTQPVVEAIDSSQNGRH